MPLLGCHCTDGSSRCRHGPSAAKPQRIEALWQIPLFPGIFLLSSLPICNSKRALLLVEECVVARAAAVAVLDWRGGSAVAGAFQVIRDDGKALNASVEYVIDEDGLNGLVIHSRSVDCRAKDKVGTVNMQSR